jgi:hypothetical protein
MKSQVVYIVSSGERYEGSTIVAAFWDLPKAVEYVEKNWPDRKQDKERGLIWRDESGIDYTVIESIVVK